jgi:ketosteroid isomerase-like protein
MRTIYFLIFFVMLFLLGACSDKKTGDATLPNTIKEQIQKLSHTLTEAERNDDLKTFLAYYDENAISMPEYQPTLQGKKEIEAFYKEIFGRQNIKTFQRIAGEIINLDSTIIEIGTFKKEYTNSNTDTLLTQNGKYWNIWDVQPDGSFKLKGEAFGFFHPVKNPEALIVKFQHTPSGSADISIDKEIPFELKAYNALMEKGVRNRDGILRSDFFTNDASFMPFADSTRTGMDKLKPYLIAYNSAPVTIDSISVYTYHHENFDDYVLEYANFRVQFTVPDFSGRMQGKGIRI